MRSPGSRFELHNSHTLPKQGTWRPSFRPVWICSRRLFGRYVDGPSILAIDNTLTLYRSGLTTSIAAIHAYLADCSTPASRYVYQKCPNILTLIRPVRARNFSLFLGLLFTGAALGPSLGSLTVRWSSNVMVVFYMSTSIHFVYALLTWFVIPESLFPVQMMTSRRKHAEEAAVYRRASGLLPRLKSLFSFLSPLTMLAPPLVDRAAASQKFRSRDWSRTLVAVAYGCVISLMGSIFWSSCQIHH